MNPTAKCRRLADAILACFEDGIAIDSGTQRYIDACLPGVSPEELAGKICDAPDMDVAPLMDLIFFPGETFQLRLEPLLQTEMYNRDDEAAVVRLLKDETIHTTLQNPEICENTTLRVPASILASFVHRLAISRRIPPGLAATISDIHPREKAIRLQVMLRNTRFPMTGPATDFLEAFILGMEPGGEDYDACFGLLLELLGEQGVETDPFRLLRIKTDTFHKAMEAALHFEKQLQRSNMETLMHQGIRAPEIGAAAAEKKIALLDRIGRAVAVGGYEARRRGKSGSSVDGKFEPEDGSLFHG